MDYGKIREKLIMFLAKEHDLNLLQSEADDVLHEIGLKQLQQENENFQQEKADLIQRAREIYSRKDAKYIGDSIGAFEIELLEELFGKENLNPKEGE